MTEEITPPESFLLYTSEDGKIRLEITLADETLWLNATSMADLFQTGVRNITKHISNIYEERELEEEATTNKKFVVRLEGNREVKRELTFYNLDVIISVGYRVNSLRGTQFRIWATQRLKEYMIKGFALDDDRFKNNGGGFYFEELLERIRDIRSSEKVFWRKVLDIYATSIDYDPKADTSITFFKTIQNKMHWAAHGHTAAEIIYDRANAAKPAMGLTNWEGTRITKKKTEIAKNYLDEEELNMLNRIVTMYLDFAELQAMSRTPMYMKDWGSRLDDFLRFSGRELLQGAGSISHDLALKKAHSEYTLYKENEKASLSKAETDFNNAAEDELKAIESIAKKRPPSSNDN